MNSYEREYFVSRLRSGIYYLKLEGIRIKILPPTLEDVFEANEAFNESYTESLREGLLTEEEIWEWMESRGLWGVEQETKIEGIEENLEKLKIKIYESRKDDKLREHIRLYLRATETALVDIKNEKHGYYAKSCEGLAANEKALSLFEKRCYVGGKPLDCNDIDISALFYNFNKLLMSETQLRELARNDPWRLNWIMKDHTPLFYNPEGRELTHDQKGILVWSNMYDNVQESMECPEDDVINDDDLLDGWFVVQRKKQESERDKAAIEQKVNPKIANSDEILVVTGRESSEAEKVHSMNSFHGNMVRKQRIATAKQKGTAVDLDFQDRKLAVVQEHNRQFKDSQGR